MTALPDGHPLTGMDPNDPEWHAKAVDRLRKRFPHLEVIKTCDAALAALAEQSQLAAKEPCVPRSLILMPRQWAVLSCVIAIGLSTITALHEQEKKPCEGPSPSGSSGSSSDE